MSLVEQNKKYLRKLDKIHPYPAKFTLDLALEYIKKYSDNEAILDPFCGSGTTLLAAKQLDKKSFGFDTNHIANLITQAKLLNLTQNEIRQLRAFDIKRNCKIHDYENIKHWFKDESIIALSNIKASINAFGKDNKHYTVFLNLIFSSIINLVSNQESDTRYASIEKKYINEEYVYKKFLEKLHSTIEVFSHISNKETKNSQHVFLLNSKQLSQKIPKDSVSLIFTSPPYPNTYDYYLYHKHRMLWLDFDVRFSMINEIGSRREYSSLKLPKEKFNNDLFEIFTQCQIVLKNKAYIVLVMGDGKIQGEIYNAKDEILKISKKFNWCLVDYSYSELDRTSKSFIKKYRTKNKKEHILVFQKVSQ